MALRRLPIEPLLAAVHPDEEYARKRLKISPATLRGYRESGLTVHSAERLCDMANLHVLGVWPDAYGYESKEPKPEPYAATVNGFDVTTRAAALVGLTYSQLDRIVQHGFRCAVPATGVGSRRAFTHEDVEKLDVVARAIRATGYRKQQDVITMVEARWHPKAPEIRLETQDFVEIVVPVRSYEEIVAAHEAKKVRH